MNKKGTKDLITIGVFFICCIALNMFSKSINNNIYINSSHNLVNEIDVKLDTEEVSLSKELATVFLLDRKDYEYTIDQGDVSYKGFGYEILNEIPYNTITLSKHISNGIETINITKGNKSEVDFKSLYNLHKVIQVKDIVFMIITIVLFLYLFKDKIFKQKLKLVH